MKNLSLKIWSFLIALATAYFVTSQTNSGVVSLIVPIELRNLPANKIVLLPQVKQAQVTIRGPSYLLSGITQAPPSFTVRVPPEVGNRLRVALQASSLAIPPAMEVLNIEPPELEFIFDDLVTQELQVVVPRIGDPGPHHIFETIEIEPKTVTVEGPKTELQGLKTIQTSPLDLRAIRGPSDVTLEVRLPGRFVKSEQKNIKAKVVVKAVQEEKKFKQVPIAATGKASQKIQLQPKQASVEISGKQQAVEKLSVKDIRLSAKIDTVPNKPQQVEVAVELPKGISLVYLDPEKVTVKKKTGR